MKKSLKIILIILAIIILLGLIFLAIDYSRVSEQKKPVFAVKTQIYKDGGTTEYLGMGYKVIDFNRLGGYDDIKIGSWAMGYNDFENEYSKEPGLELQEKNDMRSFIGTVLEETTTYMIVEPNEDEEERNSADKIRISYGTDHIDYLYGIGRKVLIKYTGYIMETYPAQINTNEISTEGYEDFELSVKEAKNIKKNKILNNKELASDGVDYNLYYYGLDKVNVKVDNKNMSLEEALRSGKITLNGIIVKANEDLESKKINGDTYKDGGSAIYKYDKYTIIKCHTLDGNRDVYIGNKDMKIDITKK